MFAISTEQVGIQHLCVYLNKIAIKLHVKQHPDENVVLVITVSVIVSHLHLALVLWVNVRISTDMIFGG